jgi:hypothetical protein
VFLLPVARGGHAGAGDRTALGKGAAAVWSGIRWPLALWLLAGAAWTFRRQRPVRERVWLVALAWGALLFLYIQGVETPVGLWSQRRFLPVVLVGIALLAAPMAAGLAGLPRKTWRWLVAALALAAGTANVVRWPAAFWTVNERGATAWTQAVADWIGTERRVVFDYYPHSVPYAAGLRHRVLGLGETSREHWPAVAEWLSGAAAREEVWLATSWSPPRWRKACAWSRSGGHRSLSDREDQGVFPGGARGAHGGEPVPAGGAAGFR